MVCCFSSSISLLYDERDICLWQEVISTVMGLKDADVNTRVGDLRKIAIASAAVLHLRVRVCEAVTERIVAAPRVVNVDIRSLKVAYAIRVSREFRSAMEHTGQTIRAKSVHLCRSRVEEHFYPTVAG